eukprot:2315461-Prymnesium_polylepis.1
MTCFLNDFTSSKTDELCRGHSGCATALRQGTAVNRRDALFSCRSAGAYGIQLRLEKHPGSSVLIGGGE